MKVVLDTNVLLSGLITGSTAPAQIIGLWEVDAFELSISEHILDGASRALKKPNWQNRFDIDQIEHRLSRIRFLVKLTDPVDDIHGVAEDDEDDLVLATAVAANADFFLMTGDKYGSASASYGTSRSSRRERFPT